MKRKLQKLLFGTVITLLISSTSAWSQQETWGMVLDENIFGLSKIDDFGFAGTFGFGFSAEGRLWKTTDGGLNWEDETVSGFSPAFPDAMQLIKQVHFFDAQNGVYRYGNPGQNDVYYTTNDGGTTLSFVTDVTFPAYMFTGIAKTHYVNNNVWYKWKRALRLSDSAAIDVIMITTDGGATWTDVSDNLYSLFGSGTKIISHLQFISATHGFAYTAIGICKTTDGGATWSIVYPSVGGYGQVHFVDANIGYIASHGANFNTLFKTTDGGVTLSATALDDQTDYNCTDIGAGTVYGQTITDMYSMDFYDANNGVAVCNGNGFPIIVRTDNGGQSWMQDSISVDVLSSSSVWSGFTPVQMVTPTAAFTHIVVSSSKRYVIGFGQGSGGTSAINELQEDDVVVYPNPASGNNLYIQHEGAQSITLINTAGQALKKLDPNNQNLNSIDISDLPSGIYFVKVETEKAAITKKVIIQK